MDRPVPEGWQTAPGINDYSPDRIFTSAFDQRGHSERLNVRLPFYLLGAVGQAINNARIPYRSVSDFARDSFFHRLHYWQEKIEVGELPEFTRAMAQAHTEHLHATMTANDQLVSDIDALIQAAIRLADLDGLDTAIEHARETGEMLGQPWKARLDEVARRGEEDERRLRQFRRL